MKRLLIRSLKHIPNTTKLLLLSDFSQSSIDIRVEEYTIEKGTSEILARSTYFHHPDIFDIDKKGEKTVWGVHDDTFCVMDLKTQKAILEAPVLPVTSSGMSTIVRLSEDGRYCALAGETQEGNIIRVHDLQKGTVLETTTGADAPVDDMVWVDHNIILLERFKGPCIWKVSEQIEPSDVSFSSTGMNMDISPNKKLLAIYDAGVWVNIFDIERAVQIAQIYEPLHLKHGSVQFITDDSIMVTGGGVISVFDI